MYHSILLVDITTKQNYILFLGEKSLINVIPYVRDINIEINKKVKIKQKFIPKKLLSLKPKSLNKEIITIWK